jgi:hypothetical protein
MTLWPKSRNEAAATPKPGRKIHHSPDKAEYKVDIDIRTCIHGYMKSDRKTPATLIVFDVQLVCTTNKGIFDYFKMDVEF